MAPNTGHRRPFPGGASVARIHKGGEPGESPGPYRGRARKIKRMAERGDYCLRETIENREDAEEKIAELRSALECFLRL